MAPACNCEVLAVAPTGPRRAEQRIGGTASTFLSPSADKHVPPWFECVFGLSQIHMLCYALVGGVGYAFAGALDGILSPLLPAVSDDFFPHPTMWPAW